MSYKIIRPPLHGNFDLPSKETLLGLKPGDIVKIMFQAGDEPAERMWVKVTKRADDSQWYGVLDDDPVGENLKKSIVAGSEVSFHPLDIIQLFP